MEIINIYSDKLRKEREEREAAERKEKQHEFEIKFNLIASSTMLCLATPLAILVVGLMFVASNQPLYKEWITLKYVSAFVTEVMSIFYFVNSLIAWKKHRNKKFVEKLRAGRF